MGMAMRWCIETVALGRGQDCIKAFFLREVDGRITG